MIASTFHLTSPHGVLSGVRLDDHSLDRVHGHPDLHPEEAARASELHGARRTSFVAGRLALSRALGMLGAPRVGLGSDARGAPIVPPGFLGSISHKGTLGVALAAAMAADMAADEDARIGVDVETIQGVRDGVDRLVLVAEERARIALLPEHERARAVLASFSIKESIYKAIDPFVQRYVGYAEAIVELPAAAAMEAGFAPAAITLVLTRGETIARLEAFVTAREGLLLSTVRALR